MLVTYKQSGESYKLSHYKFAEGKLNNNALLKAESLGVFIRILALLNDYFANQFPMNSMESKIMKNQSKNQKIKKKR